MDGALAFLDAEYRHGFGFPVSAEGYLQLCFVGITSGEPLLKHAGIIQSTLEPVAASARLSYLEAKECYGLSHDAGKWTVEIKCDDWEKIPVLMNTLLARFPSGVLWLVMLCHTLPARFVSHGTCVPAGVDQEWSWAAVEHRIACSFYASVFGGKCCKLPNRGRDSPDVSLDQIVQKAFRERGGPSVWLSDANWMTAVGKGLCRFIRSHVGLFMEDSSLVHSRKLKTRYDLECRRHKVLKYGGWPCA